MFELHAPKTKVRLKQILFAFVVISLLVSFSPVPTPTAEAAYVAPPVFSPSGGSVYTKSKIKLSSATTGATIYYTINGTTPTTSSYKYNSTTTVDLQPINPNSNPLTDYLLNSTYTLKAIAVYNGSYSSVTAASFSIKNNDQSGRDKLKGYAINVNKMDCWTYADKNCTSLLFMYTSTLNEVINFAQACDKAKAPTSSYANRCTVKVTGGTESGHSTTGSCTHANGYKFDMGSNSYIDSYILNTAYFKYAGYITINGARANQYRRISNGNIYSDERNIPKVSPHWDVKVSCT